MVAFIIILIIGLIGCSVIPDLIDGMHPKRNKQDVIRFKEPQRKLCINTECFACGRKLNDESAWYIDPEEFFLSDAYRNLCYLRYTRMPASNPQCNVETDNDWYQDFESWRYNQRLFMMAIDDIIRKNDYEDNIRPICDDCLSKKFQV